MQSHGIHNWWRMTWKQFARRSLHCVSCAERIVEVLKNWINGCVEFSWEKKALGPSIGIRFLLSERVPPPHRSLPLELNLNFLELLCCLPFSLLPSSSQNRRRSSGIESFADSRGTLLEEWTYCNLEDRLVGSLGSRDTDSMQRPKSDCLRPRLHRESRAGKNRTIKGTEKL